MDMEFDDEFDYGYEQENNCYTSPLVFAGNGDAAEVSKGFSTSNPFKSQDSQSWVSKIQSHYSTYLL